MIVRRLGALVLGVALVATVGACSRTSAEQTSGGYVTSDGGISFVAPEDREDAPEIAGETLNGEQLDLAQYEGRTIVVNVWGSWCSPCRREAPALAEVAKEYADQDVQLVGIAIREEAATSKAFADRVGTPYPSISDPASQLVIGFAGSLPSAAVPTTWVIDDQGRVAARVLNEVRASTLSGLIDDVRSGRDSRSDG